MMEKEVVIRRVRMINSAISMLYNALALPDIDPEDYYELLSHVEKAIEILRKSKEKILEKYRKATSDA